LPSHVPNRGHRPPPEPETVSASQQRGPDVIINADRLRYEMAIRGMTAGELARLACVNKNTMTRALSGRPVSRRTLRELSRALLTYPTLRMVDVLLDKPQVA
jgi:hypothetical protein